MPKFVDVDSLHFPNICIFDMKLHGVTVPMVRLVDLQRLVPAADVKPVVHGKWMPHKTKSGKNWWECSVCDFVSEHKAHHYFCPKCGARMEATP